MPSSFVSSPPPDSVLLTTLVGSSSASLIANNSVITSAFKTYEFRFIAIKGSVDGSQIIAEASINNGSSYLTSYYYYQTIASSNAGATPDGNGYTNTDRIRLAFDLGNAAAKNFCGSLFVSKMSNALNKMFWANGASIGSGANAGNPSNGGYINTTSVVDCFRFTNPSGTITGDIEVWGHK